MKKEEGIEIKKIKKNSSKGIISLFRKPKIKIKQKIILLSTGTMGAVEMRRQGVWPVHEGVTQGRSGMAAGLQGQTQRKQAQKLCPWPGGAEITDPRQKGHVQASMLGSQPPSQQRRKGKTLSRAHTQHRANHQQPGWRPLPKEGLCCSTVAQRVMKWPLIV